MHELDGFGIRLNQDRPDIIFRRYHLHVVVCLKKNHLNLQEGQGWNQLHGASTTKHLDT
jgi:hypothetical protein